ncbi:MAG: hypothetical protein KA250_08710 [Verrucomicrobiales bacterium]|jgi:hypothetical protein|nr:hypothetical protein [Verrucomicrobiales bacterium]MBP9225484.1 hypothetical protein [Verrucomicrobiales bacterium]HQZ29597.1 hypothetical protein [Verrucomicrobiales bacterium]
MTPHHRQDNPPRREPDSGSESYEGQDPSGEVAPEYYEEPAVPYDPGAAFMDENQQYGDPGQAYVDPNVAYADPNAVYDESPQSYAAEPQADYPAPPPAISHGGVYDEAPEAPAPPPVKKRIVKKKVVGRAPKPRPLTPRTPPGRGYSRPRPSYSGGGISMMTVLLTLVALGMLAIVVMVGLPKEMSSFGGYPVDPLNSSSSKPRNLLSEAQATMISRSSAITFTEEEVNQYLNARLQGTQGGVVANFVKFRGVYVDFTPDAAEIVIEREVFGFPLTMSSRITVDTFRQQTIYKSAGWSLGRIDLGTKNIKPVIELFIRLRNSCLDEYQTMQQMVKIQFEENKIVLDSTI